MTPPKRRNWNQTFMPREVRECIDQEMEKYQASHPSKEAEPLESFQAAPPAPSQEQDEQLQLAEAANCNNVQKPMSDATQQPSQSRVVHSQADARQSNGGPSQHLELSLRDWAPPTASQVLAASQQQLDQEPVGADSRADRQSAESEHVGRVSRDVGTSQRDVDPCRDILDIAAPGEDAPHPDTNTSCTPCVAMILHVGIHDYCMFQCTVPDESDYKFLIRCVLHSEVRCRMGACVRADEVAGPDLAHAWDEAPSGLGDAHDIHAPDGPGSGAPASASAPKHWTCQVSLCHKGPHMTAPLPPFGSYLSSPTRPVNAANLLDKAQHQG